MTIQIKRVYEPAAESDGMRVLVDRIWPQGISRFDARLDTWLKEVAPSTELRRWFGHQPERWKEFQQRYRAELKTNPALEELRTLSRQKPVTLLYAARDTEHNHALVLRAVLSHLPRQKRSPHSAKKTATAESSSPVCYVQNADPTYMGYLTREELIDFLNEMLEVERAGARVTLRTAHDAPNRIFKALTLAIHRDEAKWCAMLRSALRGFGATPSRKIGAFYEKAMMIEELPRRLAFLNRGQGWVVRKLREALPKIRDEALHGDLQAMLTSHEQNIQTVSASGLLSARQTIRSVS